MLGNLLSKRRIKTNLAADLAELLYFIVLPILMIAFILGMGLAFDIIDVFIPLFYYTLFLPFYLLAGGLAFLYSSREEFRSILKPGHPVKSAFSILLLIVLTALVLLFAFVTFGFSVFVLAAASLAGGKETLDWSIILRDITSIWGIFSLAMGFVFHLPRLIYAFQLGLRQHPSEKEKRRAYVKQLDGIVRQPIILFKSAVIGVGIAFFITIFSTAGSLDMLSWDETVRLFYVAPVIVFSLYNIKAILEDAGIRLKWPGF